MSREIFEIVDSEDNVIGLAPREDCHGNPSLVHRTSHVAVFHSDGRLLLQKRAGTKDIQPGKWDSAVGGHLSPGEDYETAARREMCEEIGAPPSLSLKILFDLKIRNEIESENTRVFAAVYDGPFRFPPDEIDELKFWTREELEREIDGDLFTPNLKIEIRKLIEKNEI